MSTLEARLLQMAEKWKGLYGDQSLRFKAEATRELLLEVADHLAAARSVEAPNERERCVSIIRDEAHAIPWRALREERLIQRIESGEAVPPACECGHPRNQHALIHDGESREKFWFCHGCGKDPACKYPQTHHEYIAKEAHSGVGSEPPTSSELHETAAPCAPDAPKTEAAHGRSPQRLEALALDSVEKMIRFVRSRERPEESAIEVYIDAEGQRQWVEIVTGERDVIECMHADIGQAIEEGLLVALEEASSVRPDAGQDDVISAPQAETLRDVEQRLAEADQLVAALRSENERLRGWPPEASDRVLWKRYVDAQQREVEYVCLTRDSEIVITRDGKGYQGTPKDWIEAQREAARVPHLEAEIARLTDTSRSK